MKNADSVERGSLRYELNDLSKHRSDFVVGVGNRDDVIGERW